MERDNGPVSPWQYLDFDLEIIEESAPRSYPVAARSPEGEAQAEINAEEWSQGLKCFEEVQRVEPGYRDTEELLERMRYQFSSGCTEQGRLGGSEEHSGSVAFRREDLVFCPVSKSPNPISPQRFRDGKRARRYDGSLR